MAPSGLRPSGINGVRTPIAAMLSSTGTDGGNAPAAGRSTALWSVERPAASRCSRAGWSIPSATMATPAIASTAATTRALTTGAAFAGP
jgi:hypothetical protein